MITDYNLRISTDQVLTSITDSSALSTNSIDLTQARDIGEGKQLFMNFAITTAVTNGTSTEFQIVIADNAALDSNLVVIGSSGAVVTASLTLGANIPVPIPPKPGSLGKRYLGARYVVAGTNNAGKVTADIVETIQDGKKFYASGFAIK